MAQTEQLVCPACASPHPKARVFLTLPLKEGEHLRTKIFACRSCTHRFLFTDITQQQAIEEYYGEDYSGFRYDSVFAMTIRQEITTNLKIRKAPPARILDVGCGNGEFMRAALEHGYYVEGIDISEAAVQYCHQNGLVVQVGDFLSTSFEEVFDVITMWDVVEHLRQPDAFLKRARTLLKPGGYMILKTPGFGWFNFPLIVVYKRLATVILGAPGHVQYFTPHSLFTLLHRCGYEHLEWLESRGLRSRPPTRSIKKHLARMLLSIIRRATDNKNLYVAIRV